jgi:hypothetical protein
MKRILMMIALVMTMALVSAPVTAAAEISIELDTTTFYISQLGDVTIVLSEGVPDVILATGQEFTRKGIYFSINGIPYLADALLTTKKLKLQPEMMPLKFDHEGTLDFTSGEDMLSLEFKGVAEKTKDMEMHTKTLNSYGDFVVTNGSGVFEGLEGVMGTFTLTLVCQRMPGEHPEVGDPVEVTFSAMSK